MTKWGSSVIGAAALLAAALGGAPAGADPVCVPVHAGLDPKIWDVSRGPISGDALGQVFLAEDTLITRLTVWRRPNNRSVIGAHLYITAVDTTWTPPIPVTRQILLDGPTLHVYDSDPPGQLIAMPFVIDPPLALPHPGLYAFFLQPEDCDQGDAWEITASDQNPYPYGIYWITGTALNSCYLHGVAGGGDNDDLIFDIEFCRPDATTPTLKSSWGRIKTIYR